MTAARDQVLNPGPGKVSAARQPDTGRANVCGFDAGAGGISQKLSAD
jgi:hypothetical protein